MVLLRAKKERLAREGMRAREDQEIRDKVLKIPDKVVKRFCGEPETLKVPNQGRGSAGVCGRLQGTHGQARAWTERNRQRPETPQLGVAPAADIV